MREYLNKLTGFGKEYWKFWIASAVSMAASNILQFVLSLYVLDITGSATIFALMLSIVSQWGRFSLTQKLSDDKSYHLIMKRFVETQTTI